MRASHDEYGKGLLQGILAERWANWFSEAERSVLFKTVVAKLDGVIKSPDLSKVECAVEIEAANFKQIRGALIGLARHPAGKKLFVIIKAQEEVRKKPDQEIRDYCGEVWGMLAQRFPSDFLCVVLVGSGETPSRELDTESLRNALRNLKII
jgi:hypothetical protein